MDLTQFPSPVVPIDPQEHHLHRQLWVCRSTGDPFAEPVWRCPECAERWSIEVARCPECDVEQRPDLEAIFTASEPEPVVEPVPVESFRLKGEPALRRRPRGAFNQTNAMVDWARWTWNPVTGCEHNCVYCYARDIAVRSYPEGFTPTYRPDRLGAPQFTKLPAEASAERNPVMRTAWRNVFVCSMADLFGRWVPDDWITSVFDSCRDSPEWNYLFLTKFPNRYEGLDFPETSWVGTSVDEQKRVANAEKAFKKVKAKVKWLSVEPMRERLKFTNLGLFDWVVIGGQSRSSGAPEFHPEPWWAIELAYEAHKAGCAVYFKPNTFERGWNIPVKEYPKAMFN